MEKITTPKDNQKKFQFTFVLFFIGQALLLLGFFSFGAQFKFLPSWLSLFAFFIFFGYIALFISLIRVYKVNQNFMYAAITMVITFVLSIMGDIASKSTEDFYIYLSKGFNWSGSITLCIFYVYFFLGCYDYFASRNLSEAQKHSKTGFIVFPILFVAQSLLQAGPDFAFIKFNLIANRICVYGSWIMYFVISCFVVALLLNIVIYMHKLNKKEGEKNETPQAS